MIGVIMRPSLSKIGHKISYIYDDIYNIIIKFGGIPISIYLNDFNTAIKQINMCNGVIIPGGDDICFKELKIIDYLYTYDIPTLAICLGMQGMGILFDGELVKLDNHNHKINYAHEVKINHNSLIYKILNKDKILVNSRHNDKVINTTLSITGISNDGTIEVIEDFNKKFFVGLQWHPETMVEYDANSNEIFKYFIRRSLNDFK